MTSQGQTVLVFIGITGLIIPLLVLVIAPVALVVAVGPHAQQARHRFRNHRDERRRHVAVAAVPSPFLAVTIVASLLLSAISAYFAPECLRDLRRWATEVRADLVTNIVQPGRFITIEPGLAFHIRERRPNGLLLGTAARRPPRSRRNASPSLPSTARSSKNDNGNFLVLENGSIQRHESKQRDPNIVVFDRYAFDLSQFGSRTAGRQVFGARALSVAIDLARPERSAVQGAAGAFPRRTA